MVIPVDGTLRVARTSWKDAHERVDDDDPRPRLWSIRAEVWFDWIFVNLDGNAPALHDVVAPLTQRLDGYDFERCAYGGELTFDVPANWKLAHENYLDVLHKFKIHPELERAAPLRTNSSFDWVGDVALVDHALQKPTEGRGASLPSLPGVSARVQQLGIAATSFRMQTSCTGTRLYCSLRPLAPDRTREHFGLLAPWGPC